MKTWIRDVAAITFTVAAIAIGGSAVVAGRIEPGLDLQRQADGSVVVSGVWPGGQAYRNGVGVGMPVIYIGDANEEGGGLPAGAAPPTGPLDPAPLGTYWFTVGREHEVVSRVVSDPRDGRLINAASMIMWATFIMLVGGLLRVRPTLVPAGDPGLVRGLALPTAAALAVSIALVPAYLAGTQLGLWSLVLLPALSAWPLVSVTSTMTVWRRAHWVGLALLFVAELSWLAALFAGQPFTSLGPNLGPIAAFGAVFVTISSAIVAPESSLVLDRDGGLHRRIRLFDLMLALGAVLSGIVALALSTSSPGDWANVAMVWLIAVALRIVVVPFIVSARRARSSRDLTLDAVEAERVRISGEIHDDVIQELTMLVRRLDAAADHQSAAIAREAAGRLREITGDARLPVLDDLGVAAALEWLVQRMSAVDSGTLSLSTDETARPPRAVEVAVFRVAQEAIANALRHGGAPVSVHYRSAGDAASLEIVDAGPGIPARAEEIADGAGRLGIVGMRRRAAAIGATLQIDRPDAGGTRVALQWASA